MIYHITQQKVWGETKSKGIYSISSLDKDGFIHCSQKNQLLLVANNLFKGQENLVLLCIDESMLKSKIVFEDLYDYGKNFPHIYGKINLDAIVEVINFLPKENGNFELPINLR